MKRNLLSIFAIASVLNMSAQTIIFEDNFDSYTAGSGVVAQNPLWSYWSTGTPSDGIVSTDFAASGANSVIIDSQGTDLVLPVGPYNSGKYDIKFKMYIPTGSTGGYFNALHTWSGSSTVYQWACDVFFDGSGNVTWTTGGVAGGGATAGVDTWFDIQITADMDNDVGKIYLNGSIINEFQWSLNNANGSAGANVLAAIDFFGTDAANGQGTYYIDDVQVIESTGISVKPSARISKVSVFPNPANDNISIEFPENFVGGDIQVLDLTGKAIIREKITQGSLKKVNIESLNNGVYLIKISHNGAQYTERIVKK
ncbi:MAG: T9SS type A sorting domain-containing protein [Bacteroidota bacterium]